MEWITMNIKDIKNKFNEGRAMSYEEIDWLIEAVERKQCVTKDMAEAGNKIASELVNAELLKSTNGIGEFKNSYRGEYSDIIGQYLAGEIELTMVSSLSAALAYVIGSLLSPDQRLVLPIEDTFNGDNDHLCRSIEALIRLNDDDALFPHGIGGHARKLLAASYHRLRQNVEDSHAK